MTNEKTVPKRYRHFIHILSIVLLFIPLYVGVFDIKMDINGDNATYYMLGKALAEGQGYVNLNQPRPSPHAHFPPGYPVIISAVLRIFPHHIVAVKVTNGIFLLLSLLLLYGLAYYLLSHSGLALVITLFALCNAPLLKYGMMMMSEIPFLFLSLVCLFCFIRRNNKVPPWKDPFFYGSLVALISAFYLRTLGLALLGGLVFYLIFHKKWATAALYIGGFLLLTLPWAWRNQQLGGSTYVKQLFSINPYRPDLGNAGISDFVERLSSNTVRYISKELPSALFDLNPVAYTEASGLGAWIWGMLLLAIIIYGFYKLPKFRLLLTGYAACTLAVLLLWPQVWKGIRFILPMVPLLLMAWANGIFHLSKHFFPKKQVAWPWMMVFVLLFVPGLLSLKKESKLGYPSSWNNYLELATWVKQQHGKTAIVACRKPIIFHVFSGAKTLRYPDTDDRAMMEYFEKNRVSYVVLDGLGYSSTQRYLVPTLKRHRGHFQSEIRLKAPDTELFQVSSNSEIGK